jgi:hypothetical protein
MSEISTIAEPTPSEILEKKKDDWGKFGIIVYRKELEFQVQAQGSLAKLEVAPASIEDVPAAEALLKEVKADYAALVEARKAVTSKFDEVTKRLMAPEKSFEPAIANFSAEIIKIKKAFEAEEAKKKQRADFLKNVREQLTIAAARANAELQQRILDKVNTTYTFALDKVEPKKLSDYLVKIKAKVTEADFHIDPPTVMKTEDVEVLAIAADVFKILSPAECLTQFTKALGDKFFTYENDWRNKEDAIALSNRQKAEAEAAIKQQEQQTSMAASFDAAADDLSVQPAGFKALKKAYKINMAETEANAMKIISAFVANHHLCSSKLRISKWFNFSVSNCITALEKVKSEDNAFAPAGIEFAEVDKL